MQSWKDQKTILAITSFRKGANEFNDPLCQYALGELYLAGTIGDVKDMMAIHHFKKAAAQKKQAKPCYLLGIIYLTGMAGLKADEYEASSWFNKAGKIDADYFIKLGKACMDGSIIYSLNMDCKSKKKEIKIDYKKALHWLTKAFEKENSQACVLIAQVYFRGGYGLEKNYKEAIRWCNLDVQQRTGVGPCHDIAAEIYSKGGHGITRDVERALNICKKYNLHYRKGVIYETQFDPPKYKDAVLMYKKIKLGHPKYPEAIARLGWFYYKGLGVPKDHKKAGSYFRSECCSNRSYYVGLCHHKGIDCPVDHRLAYEYYQRVSEKQEKFACATHQMGCLLQVGFEGHVKDEQKALGYLRRAASEKCHHAYNSLGDAYRYGYGVTVNLEKVFLYYTKAAELQDDCEGQYNLGMLYLEGEGTKMNHLLALKWLKKAHELGNTKAKQWFKDQSPHNNQTVINTADPTRKENAMLKKELYNILQALGSAQEKIAFLTEEVRRLERDGSNNFHCYNERIEEPLPPFTEL